jgi:hypothetical protein
MTCPGARDLDQNSVAATLSTSHYHVISYEKWVASFYEPLQAWLAVLAEASARGRAPGKGYLDAAFKTVKKWEQRCNAQEIRRLGTYKPKQSTTEILQQALDKEVFAPCGK